jgi:hypothetical protein
LTKAFSFIADDSYNLATAMVFGSTTSALTWEAFWQAIKALRKVFANRLDLVIKHKKYLYMLKWEETDPHTVITPEFSCAINRGFNNKNGNRLELPACVHVNNAIMLAVNRAHMEVVPAVAIKAIFVMIGEPEVMARQCPFAMDKWLELVIGPRQIMLGLIIDINMLTIAIPHK